MANIIEQVRIYIFLMCGRDNLNMLMCLVEWLLAKVKWLVAEVQKSAVNHCGDLYESRELAAVHRGKIWLQNCIFCAKE